MYADRNLLKDILIINLFTCLWSLFFNGDFFWAYTVKVDSVYKNPFKILITLVYTEVSIEWARLTRQHQNQWMQEIPHMCALAYVSYILHTTPVTRVELDILPQMIIPDILGNLMRGMGCVNLGKATLQVCRHCVSCQNEVIMITMWRTKQKPRACICATGQLLCICPLLYSLILSQ